jgi:eukaryotic-like serine/threonine-protein kinase
VADELRWIAQTVEQPGAPPAAGWSKRRLALQIVLPTAILIGMALGLVAWSMRPVAPAAVVWTAVDLRPAELSSGAHVPFATSSVGGTRTALAWTPRGDRIVFLGRRDTVRQAYIRDLASPEVHPIPGTEGAQVLAMSPDGRAVVFWAAGEIRRVAIGGGGVETVLAGVPNIPKGIAGGVDGSVFFGMDRVIWRAAPGTKAHAVTLLAEDESEHVLPHLIRDDAVLLYTARRWVRWGAERLVGQVLATGERKILVDDAADGRYVAPGYLVFLRRGLLMGVAFDDVRLQADGDSVALLGPVAQAIVAGNPHDITGAGQFSISESGSLAFVSGPVGAAEDLQVVTVDRRGVVSRLAEEKGVRGVRLSPSEQQLVLTINTPNLGDGLSILDLDRGSLSPLVSGFIELATPQWTPNGQRIVFQGNRDGNWKLWQVDAAATLAILVPNGLAPSSWSSDGLQLMTVRDADLWRVQMNESRPEVSRWTETPEWESHPELSPDDHTLAYVSDMSGRLEVYVRPFPGPGVPRRVSVTGGVSISPAWSRSGKELFFLELVEPSSAHMMVVEMRASGPGTPRRLFTFDRAELSMSCEPIRCFDVSRDGQRFYATKRLRREPPAPVTHVTLVLNWTEQLRAKVHGQLK